MAYLKKVVDTFNGDGRAFSGNAFIKGLEVVYIRTNSSNRKEHDLELQKGQVFQLLSIHTLGMLNIQSEDKNRLRLFQEDSSEVYLTDELVSLSQNNGVWYLTTAGTNFKVILFD